MTTPALELDGVAFAYGERRVVSDVSLAVPRGSRFALVGPNGAGKSTLVRLASGVVSPASGAIRILGDDLGSLSARELARRVGVVPQETALDFPFTVTEVVLMGRSPHVRGFGFESDRDLEAAEAAMERTGVVDLRGRGFHELSGGERQRVVIARALAQEPALLLLDEPASFLDVRHAVEIFDLLVELSEKTSLTVLFVVHDLNLAALYADRVAFLKEGRVVAEGPTAETLTYAHIRETYETDVWVGWNELVEKLVIGPLPKSRDVG